jgi:hypothetical protein
MQNIALRHLHKTIKYVKVEDPCEAEGIFTRESYPADIWSESESDVMGDGAKPIDSCWALLDGISIGVFDVMHDVI